MCPRGIPATVSFIAALVPGLSTAASVPTAMFSTAVLVPGSSTAASVPTAAPFIVTLSLGLLIAKDVLTSVSISARDLLLIVVFSLIEVRGFLDVFRFLLQGLAKLYKVSNFLF
jgi:hypothetical protein